MVREGHSKHVGDVFSAWLPFLQASQEDAADVEAWYPAGQAVHAVEPLVSVNWPGMHCRHSEEPLRLE